MKNFAIIGAAGFVAPRHLKAIKDNHCNLISAIDKSDSVGILDSYFPNAIFFTEFEKFESYLNRLTLNGEKTDFISVCSPNYLHNPHIQFGLRLGADVICEKPLVLNESEYNELKIWETKTGRKVYTILQLRLHEEIIKLKNLVNSSKTDQKYKVDLTYITSRGNWYLSSWKNDISKSGGIALNIGIHFFDMLTWIFGEMTDLNLNYYDEKKASGKLVLKNAIVDWKLSIDSNDLPSEISNKGIRTFRTIKVDGREVEFSEGFTELHTLSYKNILNGNGFGLEDALPAIRIAERINHLSSTSQLK